MTEISSLSCGDYEVYVANRGGTPLICRLTGTVSIRFRRVLNDFSDANITVALNQNCRDCLASVNPWQHEILIWRAGKLVWCGPILTLQYQPAESRIQIYARDLLAWTEKRVVELKDTDYEVYEVDIKEVFEWLLEHGYEKDPWNMEWSLSDTGVPIDRFYPGYFTPDRWGGTYPIIANELRSMAQAGIDFTVVNRKLYAGDLEVKPPTTKVLKVSDRNWAKLPQVQVNGTPMSTRTIVAGGYGGYYGWYDDQIWIEQSDLPWGLLETVTERTDIDDAYTTELPNPITQEAYARHQLLAYPLAYITGGQLAGDAPFEFNDLIPGVQISVGIMETLRDIQTEYRLYGIETSVDDSKEEISLTITLPGVEGLKMS